MKLKTVKICDENGKWVTAPYSEIDNLRKKGLNFMSDIFDSKIEIANPKRKKVLEKVAETVAESEYDDKIMPIINKEICAVLNNNKLV
jgi:hypothetical protein